MMPPKDGLTRPANFTTYMTFAEAQRALGIIEQTHFERLLLAHLTRHRSHPLRPTELLHMKGTESSELVIQGKTAKEMASCEDCYPALIAARREGTRHEVHTVYTANALVADCPDAKPFGG